jgi:hypothetical protein
MHRTLLPALLGLALAPATHAATPEPKAGVQFQHNDWSLACDNTRTCRAAGYSPEQPGNLLSLMLERAGGPGTKVLARLRNGEDGESPTPTGALRLRLNGKDLGPVRDTGDGDKCCCSRHRPMHWSPHCRARHASRSSTARARRGRSPTAVQRPYC